MFFFDMQMLHNILDSLQSPKLETILAKLSDDQSRLTFLSNLYKPGRTLIADKILDLNEDYTIIQQEADHSLKKGNITRFLDMAKRYVDARIPKELDFVSDKIVKWGNTQIGIYAMNKLAEIEQEDGWRHPLLYAARIAKHFGMQDKNKVFLESLLDLQKKNHTAYWHIAETLIELGKYNEVLDIYLQDDNALSEALAVAKQHMLERVNEIAEKVMENYEKFAKDPELDNNKMVPVKVYVKAAKILGREEQAAQVLIEESASFTVDHRMLYGSNLLIALLDLDKQDEAQAFVSRTEQDLRAQRGEKLNYYDRKQTAIMHERAGNIVRTREIYDEMLFIQRRNNGHPSIETLQEAYKATGDKQYRETEMRELEREGCYSKAAQAAEEIGKKNLAEIYRQMQTMVMDS